mmetsp:Transcript_11645/g.23495  ORF Transcript_11645/g.23495 Transcript_11645/m.23495 type:complete len:319 (+) Transcript_11645:151-1107(+)
MLPPEASSQNILISSRKPSESRGDVGRGGFLATPVWAVLAWPLHVVVIVVGGLVPAVAVYVGGRELEARHVEFARAALKGLLGEGHVPNAGARAHAGVGGRIGLSERVHVGSDALRARPEPPHAHHELVVPALDEHHPQHRAQPVAAAHGQGRVARHQNVPAVAVGAVAESNDFPVVLESVQPFLDHHLGQPLVRDADHRLETPERLALRGTQAPPKHAGSREYAHVAISGARGLHQILAHESELHKRQRFPSVAPAVLGNQPLRLRRRHGQTDVAHGGHDLLRVDVARIVLVEEVKRVFQNLHLLFGQHAGAAAVAA